MCILIGIDALGIDQPGGARTAVYYLLDELFSQCPKWNFIVYVSKKEFAYNRFSNVRQVVLPLRKKEFLQE